MEFSCESRLSQWPVQINLVPVNAPYFDGANLLIAADCTALKNSGKFILWQVYTISTDGRLLEN